MVQVWLVAALGLLLALVAVVVANWLKVSTALSEIVIGTVIALGLIFSPFTVKMLIFQLASVVIFIVPPFLTPWFFESYGGRVSELETKHLLFLLFGLAGSIAGPHVPLSTFRRCPYGQLRKSPGRCGPPTLPPIPFTTSCRF